MPLLSGRDVPPVNFRVAGTPWGCLCPQDDEVVPRLHIEDIDEIRLRRIADNVHDPNAIAVLASPKDDPWAELHVGYVPADRLATACRDCWDLYSWTVREVDSWPIVNPEYLLVANPREDPYMTTSFAEQDAAHMTVCRCAFDAATAGGANLTQAVDAMEQAASLICGAWDNYEARIESAVAGVVAEWPVVVSP